MEWRELKLHDSVIHQVPTFRVWAGAHLSENVLSLKYRVQSLHAATPLTSLVPHDSSMTAERKNDLWKATCFEAFLQGSDASAYLEFNGSSLGEWNLYSFDRYREGMKEVKVSAQNEPRISFYSLNGDQLEIHFQVFTSTLPFQVQHLGLTVVLNTTAQGSSYWAISHAGEKPDFHRKESFVYDPIRN